MGEAARRKAQIAALKNRNADWLASLSPAERTVADVAQRTFDVVVGRMGMTEGCYNLAFFLHEHLRRKHAIHVDIVLGWINDGEWDGGSSHAWVEFEGKLTDVSLHKTSHPDAQPSGDVIILDHVVKPGDVSYTYWKAMPDTAVRALEAMRSESPELNWAIAHKEAEHKRIMALATTPEGVAEYFRQSPPQVSYDALARMVG